MFLGWTMFAAAMTSDQDLRNNLISRVHNRASCNATAGVFPVFYDSINGSIYQGGARRVPSNFIRRRLSNITTSPVSSPAQGAMYAPLVLEFVYSKRPFSVSDYYLSEFLSSWNCSRTRAELIRMYLETSLRVRRNRTSVRSLGVP